MLGTHQILGLAVEENSILAAELRSTGENYQVKRTAELTFPQGISFEEPAKVGQLLRQFLRDNHFSARTTILGIPAKWVMVLEKDIPPINPALLVGMLRIQAERNLSLDPKDLVFDFSGQASSTENSSILLVATLRQTVEKINTMAQAAKLNIRSVTLSCLALASVSSRASSEYQYGLYLRPGYSEFLIQNSKYYRSIKHLPVTIADQQNSKDEIETLAVDIQRLRSSVPHENQTSEPRKLLLWDAANLGPDGMESLNKRLCPELEVVDGSIGSAIEKIDIPQTGEKGRFRAAVALAVTGTQTEAPAIDFLNPRAACEKEATYKRQVLFGIAAAIMLFLCCLLVFWVWQKDKKEVADLKQRLQNMSKDVKAAEAIVQKVSFAGGWYAERPGFLDCLEKITLAFPQEATVWVTSLAIQENMQGIITGKSVDETSVLGVLDKLKESGSFSNVQMLYMRDAGRGSKEVSFAINFTFSGKD